MKKLLIALLVLSAVSVIGYTDSKNVKKIFFQVVTVKTRSVSILPEASVGNDVLAVSFDDSGMYMLCIEDSFGATVYTSTLPADGMEYSYDLTGIGEGMFTLILEGPSGEYEGIFNI